MDELRLKPQYVPKCVYYLPQLATVESVHKMSAAEVLLELKMKNRRRLDHLPGQFVQVSRFGYGEAPFSICSSPTRPESVEVCVRAVGVVSRALHHLQRGDRVGIRGPYGVSFPLKQMEGKDVVAVAGGLGMAPLRSLVTYVVDKPEACRRFMLFYGSRDPASILFENDFDAWREAGIEVVITVDKPDEVWEGRIGVVTEPLRETALDPSTLVIIVGPPVLFRFAIAECLNKGLKNDQIFVSLERNFRCGIGKCGHCQINDLYVCQNGPVFCLKQLKGRSEALEAWAPEDKES